MRGYDVVVVDVNLDGAEAAVAESAELPGTGTALYADRVRSRRPAWLFRRR